MSTRFTHEQLQTLLDTRTRLALANPNPGISSPNWTDNELKLLRDKYHSPDGVDLNLLSREMKRTAAAIALKASRTGISSERGRHVRSLSARQAISIAQKKLGSRPEIKQARSLATSMAWKKHEHPKGFKGHHRNAEEIARFTAMVTGRKRSPEEIDAMLKTRLRNHGTLAPHGGHAGCTWHQGWREIHGKKIFFRSRWEFNYALYLEFLRKSSLILSWEHEPDTFWFENIRRGVRSYLPDFKIILLNGNIEYHEVKGWMDPKSITKLKRMKKYHPLVIVKVIQSDWFKTTGKQIRGLLPQWER